MKTRYCGGRVEGWIYISVIEHLPTTASKEEGEYGRTGDRDEKREQENTWPAELHRTENLGVGEPMSRRSLG